MRRVVAQDVCFAVTFGDANPAADGGLVLPGVAGVDAALRDGTEQHRGSAILASVVIVAESCLDAEFIGGTRLPTKPAAILAEREVVVVLLVEKVVAKPPHEASLSPLEETEVVSYRTSLPTRCQRGHRAGSTHRVLRFLRRDQAKFTLRGVEPGVDGCLSSHPPGSD